LLLFIYYHVISKIPSSAPSCVLEVYSSLRDGLVFSQPKQSSGWLGSEFVFKQWRLDSRASFDIGSRDGLLWSSREETCR
jgi:hypothetical protein